MFRNPSRRRVRRATVVITALAAGIALAPSAPAQASVPMGNLPGWTQVLHEDFRTTLNTRRWGAYSGQPGGNPYGWWSPSHIVRGPDSLHLRGYREHGRFVTAGTMLNLPQTYGKYLVRSRFTRGTGIEQVMMLWPTHGVWPPELDFNEGAATGAPTMATAHWGAANNQTHFFRSIDMRLWHVYGLEWTPTVVVFTVDGVVFGRVSGAAVPHVPMNLAIQTHATRAVGAVSAQVPVEVTEFIDWVSVYHYH